jgi:hypothetical protein
MLQAFKDAINDTYCEWFYFPIQGYKVFQNNWKAVAKLQTLLPNVEGKLKAETNHEAQYFPDYPPEFIKIISELSLYVGNMFINDPNTQ